MKKITKKKAIAIAVIICAVGVGWYFYDNNLENQSWVKAEAIIGFADGTEVPYNQILSIWKTGSVLYQNNPITYIKYKVTGTATATGYTGVEVNKNSCITKGVVAGVSQGVVVSKTQTGTVTGGIGTAFTIYEQSFTTSELFRNSLGVPLNTYGTYIATFSQDETPAMQFRGTGDQTGVWQSAPKPGAVNIPLTLQNDYTISLTVTTSGTPG